MMSQKFKVTHHVEHHREAHALFLSSCHSANLAD